MKWSELHLKKRIGKPVFFVVAILIIAFALLSTLGISTRYGDNETTIIAGIDDIRWGIDIRGGVNVTFGAPDDYDTSTITQDDLNAAKSIIETRLVSQNINDYEVFTDLAANNIIVRFPWQADDTSFDPEEAVKEIGATAMLSFRMGYSGDLQEGQTYEDLELVLTGKDVDKAQVGRDTDSVSDSYFVHLQLNDSGKEAFKNATATAKETGGRISIWMDDNEISAPTVSAVISDGSAQISGSYNGDEGLEDAKKLANMINGGSLPFKLEIKNLSTISPILGTGARDAMGIAGVIAFIVISIFMIAYYRLPGVVAVIALAGQIAGMFAAVTGFFGFNASSTLTIPGIAGIILSVGMGVDGNVLSAERIREELKAGRTIDGAIKNGFQRGFTAILDSNLTVIIVAVILMLVFGTAFGASTDGTIFSFGFTLLVGVIMNFIMACWATRMMTTSLSRFKCFKKPWLYGGEKKTITPTAAEAAAAPAPAVPTNVGKDFVSKRKIFVIISSSIIVLTIIFTFVLGVKVDIRFKGGSMLTYSYSGEIGDAEMNTVKSAIAEIGNVPEVNVTTGTSFTGGLNTMVVSFAADEKMDDEMLNSINAAVEGALPDNAVENIDTTNVSASSGSSFFVSCLVAVVAAFILLAVYIAFRFQKIGGLSAGIIAIICLLHDVAITYAVYVFGGMTLDSNFMAVILTLLGYSINNTIIIYDRLRENRAKYGTKLTDTQLVNLSINQTMPRSIITTATTVCAMVSVSIVCALMGTTSILTFSIPLAIGMLVGFYSSVCLAGPIWIWVQEKRSKKTA